MLKVRFRYEEELRNPKEKREVPLVYQAGMLIKLMTGWDDVTVLGLKSQTLDALLRRCHETAEELTGLQDWVRQQQTLRESQ